MVSLLEDSDNNSTELANYKQWSYSLLLSSLCMYTCTMLTTRLPDRTGVKRRYQAACLQAMVLQSLLRYTARRPYSGLVKSLCRWVLQKEQILEVFSHARVAVHDAFSPCL